MRFVTASFVVASVLAASQTGCSGGTTPTDSGIDTAVGDTAAMGDGPMFMSLAPCTTAAMYVTGQSTVMVGGAGNVFTPNCLTVPVGTVVTFSGDFSTHPLSASTRGSPGNPIQSVSSGTTAMVTFANPGYYPFFCLVHGGDDGSGMAGVVQVTQ